MDVYKLINNLPDEIKDKIISFDNGKLKTKDGMIDVTRVVFADEFSNEIIEKLKKNKKFVGVGSVATHKYAPEIKHSYFYVKN